MTITNFGRNIRFQPGEYTAPKSEGELLELLARYRDGTIRVVGSRHSWNRGLVSEDLLLNLKHFDDVSVETDDAGETTVSAGGGCTISRILRTLRRRGLTLPSIGAITKQTVAGAISTGTHGSGRHSLSHYVKSVRVAAFDEQSGEPTIYEWKDGIELLAARCALGCTGIILRVEFPAIAEYCVAETVRRFETVEEVLAHEADHPLQQFILVPHEWRFYVQQMCPADEEECQGAAAWLFRALQFFGVDLGFHLLVKLMVSPLGTSAVTRGFYRKVFPRLLVLDRQVIDRYDKVLTFKHHLFRHIEMEAFVPARHLADVLPVVRHVIEVFDGARDAGDGPAADRLRDIGMLDELRSHRGEETFHYPLFLRRVLPDDTLISMAAGDEPRYTISFFCYRKQCTAYDRLTTFVARCLSRLYGVRLHWGKHIPLGGEELQSLYPRLSEFREVCRRVDPQGVFRNAFVRDMLGF